MPSRLRSAAAPRRPRSLALWLAVGLSTLFFALPLVGLLQRAPWGRFFAEATSPEVTGALSLSLQCSLAAVALSALLGLPMAVWLAGERSWRGTLVRILVTLPMVLPPVVGGVAMLLVFGRQGLVGGVLQDWFGVVLPFSTAGVVLAETYVALPFFVLTVEAGLRSFDARFADAAATLGARPARVFRTVTLPMIAPSLWAGALVAWARALGEFGATITFAGNLAGETRTLPLAVYVALETHPDTAIVLSLLLVALAAAVLIGMRHHWFPWR